MRKLILHQILSEAFISCGYKKNQNAEYKLLVCPKGEMQDPILRKMVLLLHITKLLKRDNTDLLLPYNIYFTSYSKADIRAHGVGHWSFTNIAIICRVYGQQKNILAQYKYP